jgi:hypothetical protein
MDTTTEYISVSLPKNRIEQALFLYTLDVKVVASIIQEDGWGLVIEGPSGQVSDLIVYLGENVK